MTKVKTKTVELPTFEQLTEEEKEKVVQHYYDINVDYEWWDYELSEAKELGIEITEFNLNPNTIKGKFTGCPELIAPEIVKLHGDSCDTHTTAKNYLDERDKLVEKFQPMEENEYEFDVDCGCLDAEFLHAILQDYLSMISKQHDFLTEEEQIAESLIINDYTFNRETLRIDS